VSEEKPKQQFTFSGQYILNNSKHKSAFMKSKFMQLATATCLCLFLIACQKDLSRTDSSQELQLARNNEVNGHLKQTKTFSSDVAIKWMDMQVKQMRAYAGVGNVAYSRYYAYSGITLYEAVVPGMPAYQSIAPQLNGLSGLPQTIPGAGYHWAASANAALAYINRKMFPNASVDNIAAMDALESALLAQYNSEANSEIIARSVEFGKSVAEAVFNWADTDGHVNLYNPYTPPVGMSGGIYWTPPITLPVHSVQYMGNLRRIVPGSGNGAGLDAPDYTALGDWTMDVINSKPAPGTNEYNMAFWWRDFPGTSTPGHYINILRQVLEIEKPGLDVAAHAYALGGIIDVDITITTWQDKYKYLLARPFNYKDVIMQPFTALLGAPHPEYPAAHASLSIANAEAMTSIFGDNYSFTDNTFEGLMTPAGYALQPRSFSSFREAGEEAGWSRLYGGIHYRQSIIDGFWQGRKVAENILTQVKFKKG
jgi:hypothetical protein